MTTRTELKTMTESQLFSLYWSTTKELYPHAVADAMPPIRDYMIDQILSNQEALATRAKRADADQRGCHWLAEYNVAIEKGNDSRAETCLRKAQFWLDRLNRLEGKAS